MQRFFRLFIFLITCMTCSLFYAQENDFKIPEDLIGFLNRASDGYEKHLYLKGEIDGVEIRIKLLSEKSYSFSWLSDVSFIPSKFYEYLNDPANFHMGVFLELSKENNYPVEIKNTSAKSVRFNKLYDSLVFMIDSLEMPYTIDVFDDKYPEVLKPSESCSFTIKSLLNQKPFSFELYYKSYNINKLPLMIDYLIREEITTEAQAISSLAKSFGATYSIGLEKKKINLIPVFE